MRNRILHIGFLIGLLFIGKVGLGQISISAPGTVCAGAEFTITVNSSYKIYYELEEKRSSSTVWTSKGIFQTNGSGSTYTNTNYRPFIFETTRYRIKYTTDYQFLSPTPVLLPQEAEVTLFTTPIISNITLSPAVCGGTMFNVNPASFSGNVIPGNTVYSWASPSVTGGLLGGVAAVNSGTISGTLTNPTNTIQSATYTVTPTSGDGCTGTDFTVTIPIKSTPTIAPKATTICSGGTFSVTLTDASPTEIVPAGTTYTWSAPLLSGVTGALTGGMSGTGSFISGTLTNTTNRIQTATYTVTPTSADGCVGGTFTVTVTVKPRPNIANNNPPAICTGTAFVFTPRLSDIVPSNTQYTWVVTDNPNVNGESNVSTPTATFTQVLNNLGVNSEQVTYVVTPISDGCVGPDFTSVVTLIPNPLITNPSRRTVCSGGNLGFTPMNGRDGIVPANTNYTWTIASNPNVTGQTEQSAAVGSITGSNLLNSTLNNQDLIYNVTSSISNGCVSTTFQLIVTVVPVAIINSKDLVPICSGLPFTVIPGPAYGDIVVPGTTYTWTYVDNPNVNGESGVSSPTSESSIVQTLTNLTNTLQSVVYNVTSVATTCAAANFTITANINPKPTIGVKSTSICSALGFEIIPTNGGAEIVPVGTTYRWLTPTVTGGLTGGVSATGAGTISGTLTNPTNAVQTATYSVTPRSADGCDGGTFTVTVTVNPKPTIANNTTAPICSTSSFTFSSTTSDIIPVGTTFSWLTPNVTGGLTGGVSATGAGTISGTLTNPTNTAQNAMYTITPISGSCIGGTFTMSVTVNPKATIAPKTPIICSGDGFEIIPTNGGAEIVPVGTTYRWLTPTVTGGLTGGVSVTGAGTISGTFVNPTNIVQTATYTVTPTSGSCDGAAFTVTVTVNPKATIANNITTPICSANSFTFSSTSGDIIPVGTTYSWLTPSVTGGLTGGIPASGVSSITGTLTNPTNAAQNALYTITPLSGSCTGGTFTMSVTVNPKVSIVGNVATPLSICSATSFSFTANASDIIPAGSTFTWAAPTVTGGLTGGVSATSAGTISGTLTNPANTTHTALYTISSLSGNCAGDVFTMNVTVNPKATIANNITAPICSATSFTFTPTAGDIIPTGTTYSWTVPSVTGGLTGGASASGVNIITGTLTNPTNAAQTALYTITSTSGTCNGGTFTMSVTVNPLPATPTVFTKSVTYSGVAHGFDATVPGGQSIKWYNPIATMLSATPTYVNASPTPYEVYVAAVINATGCESANKILAQLTINKKVINAIASALDKVYDATTSATASVTSTQILLGDNLTFAFSTATFDNKNVGVGKTVTVTGVNLIGGTSINNYTLNSTSNTLTTTATITQKPMTVLATATDRVYNGNSSATVSLSSLDKIGLDNVVYAYLTANFNNKLAATNKLVTVTGISISGVDATNYSLTSNSSTTTATITKKELTVTGSITANKIYDATPTASVTSGILQGIISPDIVTLTEAGSFDTKNVGVGKTITAISTIGGADAENYFLTQPILPTANISAKTISVTGAVASNKIYDATVNATVTGGMLVGVYPIDVPTVQLVQSGIFADKNVANSIGVTANCSLTGADAPNYGLTQPILSAKNITAKELTMSGLTIPATKVYDATTVATVTDAKTLQAAQTPGSGNSTDGKPYIGDNVSITGTPVGTYDYKDVPTATKVNFSGLFLSGIQTNNYTLKMQDPILAKIVKKKLTMLGLSVSASKVYDGNTTAAVIGTAALQSPEAPGAGNLADGKPYTFTGGDDVRVTGTPIAVYNDKNVVVANRVIFSGLSLVGAHIYNYDLTIQSDYPATITPLTIKIKADPKTKVYGGLDPAFTYVHDPIILGDAFTGALSRVLGQNVGNYAISQGSLDLGTNYTIIYQPDNLVITEASLYLKPDTIYRTYGDAPLLDGFSTNRFVVIGLQYSETITTVKLYFPTGLGSGNDPKDPIGLYSFGVMAKDPSGGSALASNYKIVSFPGDIRVKPFPITITAEAKVKRQSQVDPPLTYVLSTSLVNGDIVTGALVRDPGDDPGTYLIRQGTVMINDNYDITYVPNLLTVLTIENIFVLPNAFTPNGDDLNDVFRILYNSSVSSINYFKVYNKAGKLVFETKNIDEGWDGKVNGQMQDSDAYYWVAEYRSWNNKIFQRKGAVVLLK